MPGPVLSIWQWIQFSQKPNKVGAMTVFTYRGENWGTEQTGNGSEKKRQRSPTDVECRILQRAIANMNFLMGWGWGIAPSSPHFFMSLSWVPVSYCRFSGVENKNNFPSSFCPLEPNGDNQVEYLLSHSPAEDASFIIWWKSIWIQNCFFILKVLYIIFYGT